MKCRYAIRDGRVNCLCMRNTTQKRITRKEKNRRFKIRLKALNRSFLKKRKLEPQDKIIADETDPAVHEIKVIERLRRRYKRGTLQRELKNDQLGGRPALSGERDIVIDKRQIKKVKKIKAKRSRKPREKEQKPKRHRAWSPDFFSYNNYLERRHAPVPKRGDEAPKEQVAPVVIDNTEYKEQLLQQAEQLITAKGGKLKIKGKGAKRHVILSNPEGEITEVELWYPTTPRLKSAEIKEMKEAILMMTGKHVE